MDLSHSFSDEQKAVEEAPPFFVPSSTSSASAADVSKVKRAQRAPKIDKQVVMPSNNNMMQVEGESLNDNSTSDDVLLECEDSKNRTSAIISILNGKLVDGAFAEKHNQKDLTKAKLRMLATNQHVQTKQKQCEIACKKSKEARLLHEMLTKLPLEERNEAIHAVQRVIGYHEQVMKPDAADAAEVLYETTATAARSKLQNQASAFDFLHVPEAKKRKLSYAINTPPPADEEE